MLPNVVFSVVVTILLLVNFFTVSSPFRAIVPLFVTSSIVVVPVEVIVAFSLFVTVLRIVVLVAVTALEFVKVSTVSFVPFKSIVPLLSASLI